MPHLVLRALLVFALSSGALFGCASKLPQNLRQDVPDAPSQAVVKADPGGFIGQAVRWGGEILSVDNAADRTHVELFGRPLFDNAEPRPSGGDNVRFLARFARFLDPAEYAPGKRLTVYGRLAEPLTGKVGEYAYRYPVVDVEEAQLWAVYRPPPDPLWYRDPYYYDPWWPWGPWGPFRRHPYWW